MAAKKNTKQNLRHKQKGMASIESVLMILVFMTLIGFTLGVYGVIQRTILASIAARAYGFELIRHRANVVYFRDIGDGGSNSYHVTKSRLFASRGNKSGGDNFFVERMPINFLDRSPANSGSNEDHNGSVFSGLSREENTKYLFNPVWVKSVYGICIDADCGSGN